MGKALIIKGADFSANKVATITFGAVPCTGISFAQDTITITSTDAVEVDYTLTPANTTDAVTWASSDNTVFTVSEGVITVIGVGTATLTATCGNYTATATVTVSISYTANWDFSYLSHPSTATYVLISANYSRITARGTGTQAGTYGFLRSADPTESHPVILLPNNTVSITVSRGADQNSKFVNGNYSVVMWMSDESCGNASAPNAALFVSESDGFNLYSNESVTLTVPYGADSFGLFVRTSTTYTESDNPNTIASNLGLTITFNAAS